MKKYNLTKEQIEDVFLCGFYSSEEGFNGEYPFMSTDDSVWNHKFNYNGLFGGNVHNGQPTLFLCQIMCIVPIDSNIHFGYVFEDSFWHGKQLFINAFSKLKELRSVGGEYNFSLYFDLEWIHKKDIIKSLKKDGLLKLIHTCETPVKGKPCGKCLKCIEIKQE